MALTGIIIEKITVLFFLIMAGYVTAAAGIMDKLATKKMTDLLLMVVNPLLVFNCFQIPSTPEISGNIPFSALLSLLAFGVEFAVAFLFVRGKDRETKCFERLCVIFPSCGFLGLPIVNSLYGSEGVIYLSICIALMNFLIWTLGILMISGRCPIRVMLKNVLSPTLIAVILGLTAFALKITLPGLISAPIDSIASMNTPLSMLISGALLYQANLQQCIRDRQVWKTSLLSLLGCPLAVMLVLRMIPCSNVMRMTQVLATACPVAATIPMLSVRHDMAAEHTSCIFGMTTLLCIATIPLVATAAGFLLQ